jgi:hypothetical protein
MCRKPPGSPPTHKEPSGLAASVLTISIPGSCIRRQWTRPPLSSA